jgi:hypothetical protein
MLKGNKNKNKDASCKTVIFPVVVKYIHYNAN